MDHGQGSSLAPLVAEKQQLAAAVERDKMIREAAAAIAGQTWGKGLSRVEQAAVARYCLEAGLDPVRHVHVLGGTVYVNAQAYMDMLASRDDYEGVEFENITADPQKREAWGVHEKARAAYLCTVRLGGRRFVEVGYAPKPGKDPVGEQFPHEKARTTALRRAARMAVPVWTDRVERALARFEGLHQQIIQQQLASGALEPRRPEPIHIPHDPYAPEPAGEEVGAAEPDIAGDLSALAAQAERPAPSAQEAGR